MSELERKLDAGRFVVTAEMPVIDGGGMPEVMRQLEPMRPVVDAFNTTDNPAAHAHASSLAVSLALLKAGVEPVLQLACRDRNRLGLEADLVGASMHGIENISCMTGDDVTAGDEPESRRVFDLDGPELIAVTRGLTAGRYLSGRRLEPAPDPEHECFEIAYEMAAHAMAQPGVVGLHFISFRKDAGIAKLCARLGIPPRVKRDADGHSAPLAV